MSKLFTQEHLNEFHKELTELCRKHGLYVNGSDMKVEDSNSKMVSSGLFYCMESQSYTSNRVSKYQLVEAWALYLNGLPYQGEKGEVFIYLSSFGAIKGHLEVKETYCSTTDIQRGFVITHEGKILGFQTEAFYTNVTAALERISELEKADCMMTTL